MPLTAIRATTGEIVEAFDLTTEQWRQMKAEAPGSYLIRRSNLPAILKQNVRGTLWFAARPGEGDPNWEPTSPEHEFAQVRMVKALRSAGFDARIEEPGKMREAMKQLLLSALSLLLVTTSNAQSNGTTHTEKALKAAPAITVNGSEIRINGKPVRLGDTFDAWKRALGGTPTCYKESIVTCVWHSHGLSLGSDHIDKDRVKFVLLDMAFEPAKPGERAPSWPRLPFRRAIELDGIPIKATTTFRDLRRQIPSERELRCGGSDCSNPRAAFSDAASIHISLDGRSEKSRILRFSISCSTTQSCVELMPTQSKK